MSKLIQVEPEYVYMTIPAEYVCVYHRILRMLADCGEQMLKDCKALCKDRNSGVIECYTMFNAAVAARKLGQTKLAETLIKYIKAKIETMANCNVDGNVTWSRCQEDLESSDGLPSLVFPVDENGQLKALVSCGGRPRFEISPDDMSLYEHKFNNGFDEHFALSEEDYSKITDEENLPEEQEEGLVVILNPSYEFLTIDNQKHPCADIIVRYNGELIDLSKCIYQYYFDDIPVIRFNDVADLEDGSHNFKCVVTYNNETKIVSKDLYYENLD